MQKPNFVLSGKFPEEKLWKIKVTGLTSWEHTFPPVADRCTWIDQICEIWGLLSFWRGENLSKSTDWAASHSQILMLRFCSSLALASLGLYPSSFAFLLKLLLCRGLDQNLLSKKRALWWFNPGKSVKSTFDLFVALFWSARCFEVNPLVVLQWLIWLYCADHAVPFFSFASSGPSVQMDSHPWWLRPAVAEV